MDILAGADGDEDRTVAVAKLLLDKGADISPRRVEFHRPMPREGAEPYEKLFRAPVSFCAPAQQGRV